MTIRLFSLKKKRAAVDRDVAPQRREQILVALCEGQVALRTVDLIGLLAALQRAGWLRG